MLNMLIIDDNMTYVKMLISTILKKEENMKLIDIANNGEEALKILEESPVDIILLDLIMPKLDGKKFLEILEKKKDNRFSQSIIVITGDSSAIWEVTRKREVYTCLVKPFPADTLLEKIHNLVKEKTLMQSNAELDDKILSELVKLGYNKMHLGTKYIKDCIKLDLIKYHGDAENITKQIYPILSAKYKKPIFSIKNNIIKATDYMYNESEMNKTMQYFKFDFDCKPTPKTVIKTVLENVK